MSDPLVVPIPEQHPTGQDIIRAIASASQAACVTERAAVVAFLRKRAAEERAAWAQPWLDVANAIERGEHRK
jgi:hypothetical protein